jgi:uncharacterized protein (TIGR02284 family)
MADQTDIATLNHLIATCRDGEMGYWSAAEHVKDEGIRWMFHDLARKRGQFAEELRQEVRRLGGAVEEGGSVAGSMHRHWIAFKSNVRTGDDAFIVAEVERGEGIALSAYEAATKNALSSPARAIIARQRVQVKEAHDRVSALEKEWRHRKSL